MDKKIKLFWRQNQQKIILYQFIATDFFTKKLQSLGHWVNHHLENLKPETPKFLNQILFYDTPKHIHLNQYEFYLIFLVKPGKTKSYTESHEESTQTRIRQPKSEPQTTKKKKEKKTKNFKNQRHQSGKPRTRTDSKREISVEFASATRTSPPTTTAVASGGSVEDNSVFWRLRSCAAAVTRRWYFISITVMLWCWQMISDSVTMFGLTIMLEKSEISRLPKKNNRNRIIEIRVCFAFSL